MLDRSKLGECLYLRCVPFFAIYFCLPTSYLDTQTQSIIITGRSVAFPGHPLGSGLTPTAAKARILWWRLCIILKFELLLSWGSLENQTCIWVEQLFFHLWRLFHFDGTNSCYAAGFNTINGLKFSGTGSCARNSCWDIIDWCSCWWCGGNWKCAPIRNWRLSWLTLYLCLQVNLIKQ